MMRAFKYRLYATRKQCDGVQFILARNRELYNAARQERKEAWSMSRVSVTYEMQSAQLPEIKEIRPEYKEIYSQILQDTLKRVDKAFKAFFLAAINILDRGLGRSPRETASVGTFRRAIA